MASGDVFANRMIKRSAVFLPSLSPKQQGENQAKRGYRREPQVHPHPGGRRETDSGNQGQPCGKRDGGPAPVVLCAGHLDWFLHRTTRIRCDRRKALVVRREAESCMPATEAGAGCDQSAAYGPTVHIYGVRCSNAGYFQAFTRDIQ
ncbi:hypothetical protein NtRootA4_23810 [Arthrobacter sp. NtRootA4]|nr:hypothetical protein NtRootA2_26000 [Arthrobacter sp. NtRootA2]BCW15402.1 hypothetical protein NtRootA4_23810 [Arthrobacter sp. NtRootA4]BCW23737.1 hypothetical protein NtRootC7_26040 [Arthrobacter sp. NtRootC7]BCW28004.1 hypothetical protein NtRootC45_26040 [Arthrobacter sp. NtRootC45]BCW32274.1 hypothetical protein NtRootD5_26050 [Arthrobacter sp. NtRootD5]